MARKRRGKKSFERAETKIALDLSTEALSYVDLAQCLSALNRRNYEQDRLYHVSKIVVYGTVTADDQQSAQAGFLGAPNTWVTANAIVKGKALWEKMREGVLDDSPSIEGKWDSFKIFLNEAHYSAGPNLFPLNTKMGEWNMSTCVMPDWTHAATADAFGLHILGADQGSAPAGALVSGGLIQGYSETRAIVTEKDVPATIGDSWMSMLTDLGGQESELADIIADEGDLPPYDQVNYPGTGSNNELQFLGVTDISNYAPTGIVPGFYVPEGLMAISSRGDYRDSDGELEMKCVIFMTPGSYKGVHAPHIRQ